MSLAGVRPLRRHRRSAHESCDGADPGLDALLQRITEQLPPTWTAWPGGWPGQIELALIDAVLSIRSRYGSPTSGVRRRAGLYREHRSPDHADDLSVLAAFDPEQLARLLQTRQRTGGALKAAAIIEAARRLTAAGVRHAHHLSPAADAQRAAYCAVRGLGPVTWEYLLMLVGRPGVKADTWITRFVSDAVGRPVDPATAGRLVRQAADRLNVSPTHLDHTIWRHARRRSAG